MGKIVTVVGSTFFLSDDGTVKACGWNNYGQLGLGDANSRNTPTPVNISNVKDIVANDRSTFFLLNDGTVKACGDNTCMSLGLGDTTNSKYVPTLINISGVKSIIAPTKTRTFFLLNDGTIKACGRNQYGELCLLNIGIAKQKGTPTTINISNIKKIITEDNVTFILFNDGTVKACGYNYYGQLGVGDTNDRNTLTSVNINNVKDINIAHDSSGSVFFILNDGTVKACGYNGYGHLGVGDTTNKSTPTLVNINNVKDIVYYGNSAFFILNDGAVKACGLNNIGQLGLGDIVDRNVPDFIRINNIKDTICSAASTFFIFNDGTVKACGNNDYGRLGLGDTNNRNTPTLVNVSSVKEVICFPYCTFFVFSDGTVKACGYNGHGQFGLGDTTDRNIPTVIPGITLGSDTITSYLYLKNTQAYAEQNNVLTKVSEDYPSLSSTDKKALFLAALQTLSSADKLNVLGAFKILRYSGEAKDSFSVTAVPKSSILKPNSLLNIPNISKVTATGNGKVFVTTDLLTYKAYDGTAWTESEIGMDASELPNITRAKWRELGASIAFAYLIDMESTSETKEIGDLTIETQAPDQGYEAALKGADYTYSYPNESTLRVKFLTDGNYKINWS